MKEYEGRLILGCVAGMEVRQGEGEVYVCKALGGFWLGWRSKNQQLHDAKSRLLLNLASVAAA